LAFFIKYVKSTAVFLAAIITQGIIITVYFMDLLPYLWLNLLGCALVIGIAVIIQNFISPEHNDIEEHEAEEN
ncbi:sodium:solute symporter, partial [Salinimicrobium sp. CDJ15-91]|nr:sodium:solute symporter [Salinimicrobium oceani]